VFCIITDRPDLKGIETIKQKLKRGFYTSITDRPDLKGIETGIRASFSVFIVNYR